MISEADSEAPKRPSYDIHIKITMKGMPLPFVDNKTHARRLLDTLHDRCVDFSAQFKAELTITGQPWERYELTSQSDDWKEEGGQS